ncbi:MAG: hypothetical protein ACYSUP_07500 [Planctomycetota bacterium]|jgi:hypothetical protein
MRNQSISGTSRKTSRLAITSLSLAVAGWLLFVVGSVAAVFLCLNVTQLVLFSVIFLMWALSVVFGVVALVVIRCQHIKGKVPAISGLVLSILPLVGILWFVLTLFPKEVTKVSKYTKVRRELWHNPRLIGHFPDKIPADANDVRFSYLPGFLQGGAWFQVKMTLPEDRINQLFEEFGSKKIKSFQGGGWSDHANSEGGIPTPSFRTGESDSRHSSGDFVAEGFPKDFVVIVLGTSGNWNHGTSHGVAISKPKNEIVYWAEDW